MKLNYKDYKVQERHQVDLVSMVSMPATIDGDTYKYIMHNSVDFFSYALFKQETREVAEHRLDIYIQHGPSEILQSDQGPEFKEVVKNVCERLNVRIIKSSACSPDPRKRRALTQNMEGKNKV